MSAGREADLLRVGARTSDEIVGPMLDELDAIRNDLVDDLWNESHAHVAAAGYVIGKRAAADPTIDPSYIDKLIELNERRQGHG